MFVSSRSAGVGFAPDRLCRYVCNPWDEMRGVKVWVRPPVQLVLALREVEGDSDKAVSPCQLQLILRFSVPEGRFPVSGRSVLTVGSYGSEVYPNGPKFRLRRRQYQQE